MIILLKYQNNLKLENGKERKITKNPHHKRKIK